MRKLTYILICVLFVALSSCHSARKGVQGTVENQEALARYEAAVGQSFDFTCLQGKVKYDLGGKSLSGKLSIEQGKRLTMTMTVLGAEVARVEADQERVYVSEKLDKVYAKLSIAEAATALGMQDEACYDALEALVLGRIFLPGKGYATLSDFGSLEWSAPDEAGVIVGTYAAKQYLLLYAIDADNRLCQTQVEVPQKGATFTWSYNGFQTLEEKGSIPAEEQLNGKAGAKDITLKFTINNPQLVKKGITPFKEDNYREVSFEELITMVKSLK